MGKRETEVLVGGFVLLGMLAIFFLALKAANLASFSVDSTYVLQARFDNIGGLKSGAPVKSAGVTVGRVASIAFDNKTFQGVVVMDVDSNYLFPTDTSAKILTAGLLGDQYIGLSPGGEERNLKPGDTIRMAQSAMILEDLIGQLIYSKAAEPAAPGAKK